MKDIAMTDYNGDIELVTSVVDGVTVYDFALTTGNEDLKQILYNRLSTQNPDWYLHMIMGASLEEMIGEPNTRENGERIASKIKAAINYLDPVSKTRIIDPSGYEVRIIPVNIDTVLAVITINDVQMYIDFSYSRGIQEVGIL